MNILPGFEDAAVKQADLGKRDRLGEEGGNLLCHGYDSSMVGLGGTALLGKRHRFQAINQPMNPGQLILPRSRGLVVHTVDCEIEANYAVRGSERAARYVAKRQRRSIV